MAKKLHAIILSAPFQGHINPTTNLALKLASKGITVTFVHTDYVHYTLTKSHRLTDNQNHQDFFSEARKSGLDIRYRTFSDGFPMDFDRFAQLDVFGEAIIRDFPVLVHRLIGDIIASDPDRTSLIPFLVADTFFSWSNDIAQDNNLVSVSFWTQPASVLSIGYHLDLMAQNGHFPCKDDVEEEITYLPGIDSINTKHLMPYLRESQSSKIVHKFATKAFEEVKKADFILCNTVDGLEQEALSALNQRQPIYAIGPVSLIRSNPIHPPIPKSLLIESDCSKWLESKQPGSVLYVSFGSLAWAGKEEIQEIAYGLMLSEVNFIWVVRANNTAKWGQDNIFPARFDDEINDKGLVIPWCDQVLVLSNPAVGGFLTHCGWNSLFESMSFGVPMICFPLLTDQFTNRKLVVDDWKIGINLFDGSLSVHREEIAHKIKKFMDAESSKSLRQEAKRVKIMLQKGIEIEGSSERKLDQFVKDLKAKICSSNKDVYFK